MKFIFSGHRISIKNVHNRDWRLRMVVSDHRERLEPLDCFFHRLLHPLQPLFHLKNIIIDFASVLRGSITSISGVFDLIWVPIKKVNNPLTIGLKTAAFRSSGQNLCREIFYGNCLKGFWKNLLHSSWAEPRTRMGRRRRQRERGILFLNPFTCFKRPVLSPKIFFSRNSVSLFFTLDTSHPCVQPAGGAQRCSYQTCTAMR